MRKDMLLDAYRQMLRIRLIEERLVKEYLAAKRYSFVHFYIGQEATAIGVCMNLKRSDYVFSTHRSHGHYLAKSGNLKRMTAELYGKAAGCSKGRGGSMHLIDKSAGFMGSISILSSVVPIAVGAAFSIKKKGKDNISVVFLGDGAADEGAFYESMNLAALMEVPVLFIVENNLYAAMSDASVRHPKEYNLGSVAMGLGTTYFKADGNDFIDVYSKTKEAKKVLPAVIECMTMRHMAHSAPIFDDKLGYRKADPLEIRLKNCPLKRLKKTLIESGYVSLGELNELKKYINKEIDEAMRFAERSPYPKPEELTQGVYHE